MKIYIGNLALSVTERILKDIFSEFGEIVSVKIVKDKYSGRPRGFAYVEMKNISDAKTAMEKLNGKEIQGKNVKVNEAQKVKTTEGLYRGAKGNRYRW
jgi:RNA recognition motif-containing protein